MQPSEWRKSFENKTESELEALTPSPGLPYLLLNMWRRDRDEALARLRPPAGEAEELEEPEYEEDAEEKQLSFSKERDALEAAMSALDYDTSRAEASTEVPPAQPLLADRTRE